MPKVLITGGTGLVGTQLTTLLEREGFEVMLLSRSKRQHTGVKTFRWSLDENFVEEEAIATADHIIHLAGTNVGEKRWTPSFKKQIIDSRVNSANLLYDAMNRIPNHIQSFISSSAIGYYGDHGDEWITEDAAPAQDFWGTTCVEWEAAARQMESIGKRVAILRTGIVLTEKGGALPPLMRPVKLFVAPVFGTGKQWYSWIHIDDLCSAYLFAIKNPSLSGTYNAVAPNPERYKELMKELAHVLNRKPFYIPVPMSLLKIAMGDFVETLTFSMRCSSNKMEAAGFQFQFRTLKVALKDLL